MPTTEPRPDTPFFIVMNAGSGHSETELRRSTIEEVLRGAGRSCHLEVVEDPEQLQATARSMAARAVDAGGTLVAAGGDGTINTVAHEAVLAGCPFGVLPQGTFNYFGRTHGIPEDLAEAVYAMLRAKLQPVQVGLLNNRIFLVNASVGLYPRLLEEREHDKKQYGRSRVVAFFSAIKIGLRAHRHLRITLELDGKERHLRTTTLFVGNNRLQLEQVGMRDGLIEAVEDGQLVAIAPRPMGKLGLLGLLVRGMLGRLGEADDVEAFAFKRLTVRTPAVYGRRRMKVATDGEVEQMAMPLEFRVLEGRLLLLVQGASRKQARTVPEGDEAS
ncbi:diacylglycerol/lipid kinase family protein [Massilia yuzhufengensis]|uniref:Diacylglycerol kinase family enzyme n=1 Tax=Massilia yuzhufengensis TaxID=1164594 RepID=A0A1I1IHA6_9BURK|nr:diacylglycerol kinase family protein [Massilia yuzhufengensis]SFC33143.1 Diacylglycerol kinase family enzyme [Massilia yuzhufengensis]